ncbi:fumarylacetoacetase [Persicobacter psychrovividus]|uniref:fumarylacetoacetase n=1 Tax=Persicobacter psychrovividus TaxID=387638 RepID=A0ABN6LBP7_9BACT|nr:fumarylacetoacetase [Persicobacter psychrovividus]
MTDYYQKMNSWVPVDPDSGYTIHNLPFGIFSTPELSPRVGVALGDYIIDMRMLARLEFLEALCIDTTVFNRDSLNDYIDCGRDVWKKTRQILISLLRETDHDSPLKDHFEQVFVPRRRAMMHPPIKCQDYTDFYSSLEHATNVGKMFRPDNPLMPNWRHMPVGYHGRSSSLVTSGHEIIRPQGQIMPKDAEKPVFSASKALDFELEMAFIVGKKTEMGEQVPVDQTEDYIFGMVLFNDWSARDIQKWEYQPLGPFLGKSFASSMSPWVITMDALEPFRCEGPEQEPEVLPYLKQQKQATHFDINLSVEIRPGRYADLEVVSKSNAKFLYWSIDQQLAHQTVNGCNINIGDMMASGTISGPTHDSCGSLLELTKGGSSPILFKDGQTRTYLQDDDVVILRGHCEKNGIKVSFGHVRGYIGPAREPSK